MARAKLDRNILADRLHERVIADNWYYFNAARAANALKISRPVAEDVIDVLLRRRVAIRDAWGHRADRYRLVDAEDRVRLEKGDVVHSPEGDALLEKLEKALGLEEWALKRLSIEARYNILESLKNGKVVIVE